MNLLRTLATISSMTLLSRILGFVRDFVIARAFGAGVLTDAFFVAFKLPNLLRRLFAEGAFAQAFVPILGEYKNKRGETETRRLVDHVASLLFLILLVVTLLGMAAAPLLVYISAPGFAADPGKFALTVTLTRITFPYILFMSLVALCGGILNTWNRFAIPAFTPVLLNVAFISWRSSSRRTARDRYSRWAGRCSSAARCNWRCSYRFSSASACCRASRSTGTMPACAASCA